MISTKYDLVIIGAGCAGLSLGYQLSVMGAVSPKTLLIESRLSYENDRTWCFWEDKANPFNSLCTHQWKELLIINKPSEQILETTFDCHSSPYQVLTGGTFYQHTIEAIALNSNLELALGIDLLKEPEYRNGLWYLKTNEGSIAANMVVDTRPVGTPAMHGATLWQSFSGYEVECLSEKFDPRAAVLMDFCPSNSEYTGFTYLLPISKNVALIEFTSFGVKPYAAPALRAHLEESVKKFLNATDYKVRRSEYGLIPMGLKPLDDDKAQHTQGEDYYVRVGVNAGAARPSTGYSFQRIQNWSVACALSIVSRGVPIAHVKDPYLLQKMDALFLNVLKNNPNLGPELFFSLFSGVNPRRLIRFLTDKGEFLDLWAVIRVLPKVLFLSELLKTLIAKLKN